MSLIIHYQPHNDFGDVRDWYVPHPLLISLQIGYLILEEKSYKKFVKILR
jgi:hypothetical protein